MLHTPIAGVPPCRVNDLPVDIDFKPTIVMSSAVVRSVLNLVGGSQTPRRPTPCPIDRGNGKAESRKSWAGSHHLCAPVLGRWPTGLPSDDGSSSMIGIKIDVCRKLL